MAVREFVASSGDDIVCAAGALAGMRYGTVAIIAKRNSSGDWHAHFYPHDSDGDFLGGTQWSSDDFWNWFAAGHSRGPAVSTDTWYLCVVRKDTGGSTPRYSVYDFTAESWTHADGASARNDFSSPGLQDVRFSFEGTGDFLDGRVAVRAAWNDSLPWSADSSGDTAIEAAGLEDAAANWLDADPDAMWLFNQESTSTAVEDVTDGGADQTSISGTNVVTDDDPPGFDFSLDDAQDITPDAVTVEATPGTLTIDTGAVDITPDAVTVEATPGTLSMALSAAPDGPTVEATPGTLSVEPGAVDITPDPVTVEATPGTLTMAVDLTPGAVTIDATPGALALAVDIPLAAPTVEATPGTVTVEAAAEDTITPDAVTVEATPGTLTVAAGAVDITPDAVLVDATPGTLALTVDVPLTAPTVQATPGTVTLAAGAAAISPEAITLAVTPGVLAITGGETAVTPADRTLTVQADGRTLTVNADARTLTAQADGRTVEVS